MTKYILLFVLVIAALPAMAQVAPMECQLLPVYTAGKDVAYKPGVDVRGKPVVPADLNAPPPMLPKTIVVPLSIDLAERLRNANLKGVELKAPLGMLEIHPNGRVVYDDQDLTPQVYASCGRENIPAAVKGPDSPAAELEATPVSAPKGNGQPAGDGLESQAVEVAPVPAIPPKSEVIEGGESRQEGYR